MRYIASSLPPGCPPRSSAPASAPLLPPLPLPAFSSAGALQRIGQTNRAQVAAEHGPSCNDGCFSACSANVAWRCRSHQLWALAITGRRAKPRHLQASRQPTSHPHPPTRYPLTHLRLSTTLMRPARGRNLAGMLSHVLRPITTAFCGHPVMGGWVASGAASRHACPAAAAGKPYLHLRQRLKANSGTQHNTDCCPTACRQIWQPSWALDTPASRGRSCGWSAP